MKKQSLRWHLLGSIILLIFSLSLSSCQEENIEQVPNESSLVPKADEMISFENALRNLNNRSNIQAIKAGGNEREEAIQNTLYVTAKNLIYSTGVDEKYLNQHCHSEAEVISLALRIHSKNAKGKLKTRTK